MPPSVQAFAPLAGWLAKGGVPAALLLPSVLLLGALMGALNGALVGYLRLPSIIVTLAMLTAWRDALRWATQGAWVQDLPANFQWFGLGQTPGQLLIVAVALAVLASFAWMLRNLGAGRAIYAVGSQFAVCSVAAGLLAKTGIPMPLLLPCVMGSARRWAR